MTDQKPKMYRQLALFPNEEGQEGEPAEDWVFYKQKRIESQMMFKTMGERPPWYEAYERLVAEGWRWRIAAYIAWATCPVGLRWPKSQKELAINILGLTSARAIQTWRARHPLIKVKIAELRVEPMLEYHADVIQALIDSAVVPEPGHATDRKLFLEMTGDYKPPIRYLRKSEGGNGRGLKYLSDAELEELIR